MGEGPKSLLFGGGARGGVARIVKKMIIGMTLTIHIFAQIDYIWALKSRLLHLQKMHCILNPGEESHLLFVFAEA